jgi:hypothetical protein
MFEHNGFKKIGEDIYVYHNFISDDLCNLICNDIELIKDEDWDIFYSQRYVSKVGGSKHLKSLRDKVASILDDGLHVGEGLSVQKVYKDGYFHPHTDDADFREIIYAAKSYVAGQEFDLVRSNAFGFIVYLNNFDGGEIEYPNQAIKYKPLKGDLLIHGAHNNCLHQVNKVLSDVRYTYANNIFELLKVTKGAIDVA